MTMKMLQSVSLKTHFITSLDPLFLENTKLYHFHRWKTVMRTELWAHSVTTLLEIVFTLQSQSIKCSDTKIKYISQGWNSPDR